MTASRNDELRGGGRDGGTAGDGDRGFTAAVFALALLPRLYVAIAWAREPIWDGHYYDFGAKRIAQGFGYSDDVVIGDHTVWHPWCHYPVGYSALLGAAYRVFGEGPHVAPIVNAVTGALTAAVVHRLARYATTAVRARLAAIFTALSPGLVIYAALLMTEPLAALGILTAAWLFARERGAVKRAVTAGVALGLTTLVRPQSLLVAPAFAILAWRDFDASPLGRRVARSVAPAALALATALAVVAPWTARNCRVMDGCAFVSTNAGWNLAIGAFPRATGRFETLHATDGCPVVTGQVQQDRCWLEEGIRWIEARPLRWIALMPDKLAFTFDHESFPMGYLGEADPVSWTEARKAFGRELLSTLHRLLMAAAALAFVTWPLDRSLSTRAKVAQGALALGVIGLAARSLLSDFHPTWPFALVIPVLAMLPAPGSSAQASRGGVHGFLAFAVASVAATHAVFFGEDRYHMVLTPALCLLAACALARPAAPRPA